MDEQKRIVDDDFDELLGELRALAIEGARLVGKTECAPHRGATVYLLDDPLQRQIVKPTPGESLTHPTDSDP
ncbi:MAG: hypothetical protein KDB86_10935 [Actinobacteria bacterium]|nr:hypothetical protein [Actinomycetota bacterium]